MFKPALDIKTVHRSVVAENRVVGGGVGGSEVHHTFNWTEKESCSTTSTRDRERGRIRAFFSAVPGQQITKRPALRKSTNELGNV